MPETLNCESEVYEKDYCGASLGGDFPMGSFYFGLPYAADVVVVRFGVGDRYFAELRSDVDPLDWSDGRLSDLIAPRATLVKIASRALICRYSIWLEKPSGYLLEVVRGRIELDPVISTDNT